MVCSFKTSPLTAGCGHHQHFLIPRMVRLKSVKGALRGFCGGDRGGLQGGLVGGRLYLGQHEKVSRALV